MEDKRGATPARVMARGEYIFVYGTLRRGERADLDKYEGSFGVKFIGTDEINGELYHLGSYPGLKLPDGAGEFNSDKPGVTGDVFSIADESITAILDAYEGYPHLYDRTTTGTRQGRTVWVYTYTPEARPEALIKSGDWQRNAVKLSIGRTL